VPASTPPALFEPGPTVVRVGSYSVDPAKFRAIVAQDPNGGAALGTDRIVDADGTAAATEWAIKQALLRALAAPLRLRARWAELAAGRHPDGGWTVTSRGPVRQFHEAHTLGHVDVAVTEAHGRITAYAVLTRDSTEPEESP